MDLEQRGPLDARRDHLTRDDLEDLIFRSPTLRRFTQDSPILPDVWIAYGLDPQSSVDLLMVPNRAVTPGELYVKLREHLGTGAALAYHQSTVVARLTFAEVARVLLPLSHWRREFWADARGWQQISLASERMVTDIALSLTGLEHGRMDMVGTEQHRGDPTAPLVLWTLRLVGTIEMARQGRADRLRDDDGALVVPIPLHSAEEMVAAVRSLVEGGPDPQPMIFSVSRNRPADVTVFRSVPAVKADAARRLFQIDAADLRWAVVDSGIDARHPAFRKRQEGQAPGTAELAPEAFDATGPNNTRIIATYDFTPVRTLLDVDALRARAIRNPTVAQRLNEEPELVAELERTLEAGQPVSWSRFAELLRIPHTATGYRAPINEHGTHVGGILAGDWQRGDGVVSGYEEPDEDLIGMCPAMELYDLRVLGDDGTGDEFSVMAALQFVRGLNTQRDYLAIHGVNLSMAIKHDVANYACGRTPICDEAERLVATGATVVAAAGNEGYIRQSSRAAELGEGYRSISITDPGNAEAVITVGATHGYRPLTYGVSYFSSRGPTGDGRRKPDLVAPGEKIWSAVPGSVRVLDGTSMAAPHVSGCAALLMARHRELIGQPARIKQILCSSATDLGREPYFQGHGLVDVLRAIQSL